MFVILRAWGRGQVRRRDRLHGKAASGSEGSLVTRQPWRRSERVIRCIPAVVFKTVIHPGKLCVVGKLTAM